ncbi:MAG: hypothetical protein B5766_11460 [Candidatus Lumbricidophila eiseniae]|uniref:Uncharacterized protein n=1 Tax=Candidatus Lumbricidiphila eiseniae TaxID=1969409 RepID=A0A2A6FP87_9MICO|nr:MAG: hypothetical protein B5766_11460 [Candidatus Lumbricidophila eiseniae]
MRLGTRWPFGTPAPHSVPPAFRLLIAATEAGHADGTGQLWTLTWLEGHPVAELDDGTLVSTRVAPPDRDDTW